MPLGGYCEECGRWVWLTPYGDCEYGHKARNVRDVQQLRASQSTALAEQEAELVADSGRTTRFRFWWRHSLWIGWTLTGGVFNWVAFMYISARSRYKPWALWGFAYLLPLILTMIAWGTPLGRAFLALQLVAGAGSFLHALYLRPYYRAVMFGDMSQRRRLPAPPEPPPLLTSADRPALMRAGDERAREVIGEAREQVDTILDTARGIGKPAVRDEIVRLCKTADQILAELSAEPRKVAAARSFLTYYLDAAQRIVESYADLMKRGVARGGAAGSGVAGAGAATGRRRRRADPRPRRAVAGDRAAGVRPRARGRPAGPGPRPRG